MRRVAFWQLFIKKREPPYIKNLDQIILIQIFFIFKFPDWDVQQSDG